MTEQLRAESRPEEVNLPLLVKWEEFLEWILERTAKYPRSARHSVAHRIDEICLGVALKYTEARYSQTARRVSLLKEINLDLEKLRLLLRVSHHRTYLSHTAYDHAARIVNDCGQMTGGWIRTLTGKGGASA